MVRKTPLAVSALTAALFLVGCAGEPYDQNAHRETIETYGERVTDMDAVTRATESACAADSADAWVDDYMDQGGDPGLLVIGLDQMCADRVKEFEGALSPYGW
ncbi:MULTISPECIES: hypothetical protein [unclassified Nocardiopsis]|uniref:hypothetical protein n=1 Tax=unclassified Nocardiopsis TaxID=2649073 RepID=UPI0033FC4F23